MTGSLEEASSGGDNGVRRVRGEMIRRSSILLAFGVVTLTGAAPAFGAAVPGSASLVAADAQIVAGSSVQLSGAVESEDVCRPGRPFQLESRVAGQALWEAVTSGQSGNDGQFTVSATPQHTSESRVVLAEVVRGSVVCEGIVSTQVLTEVLVHVSGKLSRTTVRAGNCLKLAVSVVPAKAGQSVRIQQGNGEAWRTLQTPVLDAASHALVDLCFGWDSIGTVRLRATWPKQDELNLAGSSGALDLDVLRAGWMIRIDRLTEGRSIGVAIEEEGTFLYRRASTRPRIPASNQKLLLSMALLDRFGPEFRLRTVAAAPVVENGIVRGDLWILGTGDPTVDRRGLSTLVNRLASAGIIGIDGRVMGSTSYFSRDWFAPGWKASFPEDEIALPSALTFRRNELGGRHVADPERRAAAWVNRRLRARGVSVAGDPGSGNAPDGLIEIAAIESRPLGVLLRIVNRFSWNFGAEVLGKRLGLERSGAPGTIAKGAEAVRAWAAEGGTPMSAYDSSGLSYRNRISPTGIVRLLALAEDRPWGPSLHAALPGPGQGTMKGRLGGVMVRAKTGTLTRVSSLSGWVWLERRGVWAEFSIISGGLQKPVAMGIENAIVRTLARSAR
jgi:D-alanyl-D-alanine carboxypeptidase/D-alanyl-D-alanine-endopeptidase (penicillin-binding protein 4)